MAASSLVELISTIVSTGSEKGKSASNRNWDIGRTHALGNADLASVGRETCEGKFPLLAHASRKEVRNLERSVADLKKDLAKLTKTLEGLSGGMSSNLGKLAAATQSQTKALAAQTAQLAAHAWRSSNLTQARAESPGVALQMPS